MNRAERRDLVVLGGGAGGLVVASVAAQLGLQVTLVEKRDRLGGDCLHFGCVPSKTLIRVGKVAALMRRGGDFGLPSLTPSVDFARVRAHLRAVIDQIQVHDDPERFRAYGCEVLFQPGSFVGPTAVRVGGRVIAAKRFVIATGAHPFVPPIAGLSEAGYLTNEEVFALEQLPARLVVIGAGVIALELAQAFARLGSEVHVLMRGERLLPQEDPEASEGLQALLQAEGVQFHPSTSTERISVQAGVRHVHCRSPRRGEFSLEAEQILVATGRRPSVGGLGLEAAGVAYTANGVSVDARLRTSRRHIYACGDVCGPYNFTHAAEYQAGVVISNAVFRVPKRVDYRVMPGVVFTDPELASVGLTEAAARDQGLAPTVLRFEFKQVDRALTESEARGFVKLVTRKGRVLGATILGPAAGELIHELALAMRVGATLADISSTVHAYPTLAQIHRRVVNTHFGAQLFSPRARTLVKWINRLLP